MKERLKEILNKMNNCMNDNANDPEIAHGKGEDLLIEAIYELVDNEDKEIIDELVKSFKAIPEI